MRLFSGRWCARIISILTLVAAYCFPCEIPFLYSDYIPQTRPPNDYREIPVLGSDQLIFYRAEPVEPKMPGRVEEPVVIEAPCRDSGKKLFRQFHDGYVEMGVLARGYYVNDQRMEWSGNEATFGAEGILTPRAELCLGNLGGGSLAGESVISVAGEFYLNLPYERNIYLGNPERASYVNNFDIDPFEVSQLYVSWKVNHFEVLAGKFETPFGRYHSRLLTNSRMDAPFIRTESILWRQTGILVKWSPSVFEIDVGVVNGCEGLDTNSMKAGVARAGLNFDWFQIGVSGLFHDGIGSEEQKEYKSHFGVDAMVRFGKWVLSTEIIYDRYGMFHEIDQDQIFWRHSIYYRQVNKSEHVAIWGMGYYVDLSYQGERLFLNFNYGEFYPEQLHLPEYPQHDIVKRRFLAKIGWKFCRYLECYGAVILENGGYAAQDGRPRRCHYLLTGIQMGF